MIGLFEGQAFNLHILRFFVDTLYFLRNLLSERQTATLNYIIELLGLKTFAK